MPYTRSSEHTQTRSCPVEDGEDELPYQEIMLHLRLRLAPTNRVLICKELQLVGTRTALVDVLIHRRSRQGPESLRSSSDWGVATVTKGTRCAL